MISFGTLGAHPVRRCFMFPGTLTQDAQASNMALQSLPGMANVLGGGVPPFCGGVLQVPQHHPHCNIHAIFLIAVRRAGVQGSLNTPCAKLRAG